MWGQSRAEEKIECSLVHSPVIYLEPIPRSKIQLLMKEYPHQEWLAYLKGKLTENKNVVVEDISVPPHEEVSGGSATAVPFNIPIDCVGVIHSHHGMGAFHSGTDQAYVDKNFPVSITVAKGNGDLQFDAVSYSMSPCGKGVTQKTTVKYVHPVPEFDRATFLAQAKAEIAKGKKVYKYVQQGFPEYSGDWAGRGINAWRETTRGFKELLPHIFGDKKDD